MYNLSIHHRHTIRLKGYDYSNNGMYFITICTHNRKCILGEIVGAGFHARPDMNKNINQPIIKKFLIGMEIENAIDFINNNYTNAKINEYVIMPNHLHFIVELKNKKFGRAWKPAPT